MTSLPQPGIFGEGTSAHLHLEWRVRAGVDDVALTSALRAALGLAEETVTVGGVNVVVGFGADLWRRRSRVAPAELSPFVDVGTGDRRAPATQRDIWLWLHGSSPDIVFDNGMDASKALREVADLELEQFGYRYRDSRDLTGFIDGTENPKTWEAGDVALIPDGAAGTSGSYAMTMKWVHDLDRFCALPPHDQEQVIGRTKYDSVELDDDDKPASAHISRVVIEEGGVELELFRRSVPYFGMQEHGLYFVAFSASRHRYDAMLARMFGTSGDGAHDRLTEFTRPVSGSFWFVPSLPDLSAALDLD